MVAEKGGPRFGEEGEELRPVVDDVSGDLGDLVRPGSGGRKGATDVGEGLARLTGEIAWGDEVPVPIVGDLARDEDDAAAGGNDDMGVGRRGR